MTNTTINVFLKDSTNQYFITGWTEQQKQEFLNKIKEIKEAANSNSHYCHFSVHYDKRLIQISSNGKHTDRPINYPINKQNSLIIQMYPGNTFHSNCLSCLRRGQCVSPLIKENIAEQLFQDKYENQK